MAYEPGSSVVVNPDDNIYDRAELNPEVEERVRRLRSRIVCMPGNRAYGESWERVFGHGKSV